MTKRNHSPLLLVAGVLFFAGCSTRGYRAVAVAPPAPVPAGPPSLPRQSLPPTTTRIPENLSGTRQPRFDQVADIIEKAEAAFDTGRRDYRAGHLEVAKTEFNSAIDSILQAPISMQEDRRLAKEFDS